MDFHVYATEQRKDKFEYRCKKCLITLSHGKFAVMSKDQKMILIHTEMTACIVCGQAQDIPLYFYEETDARAAQQEITEMITNYSQEPSEEARRTLKAEIYRKIMKIKP